MADKKSNKNSLPLSNFTIVVIVSILIAMGLIALGLFAYNAAEDTNDEAVPTETQSVEEEQPVGDPAEELTPQAIDEEVQQIDEDLNELDESDFDENTLSDEELGL